MLDFVDNFKIQINYAKFNIRAFMAIKNTVLGDKLTQALEKKNTDINLFVWKGRKVEKDGKFVQEEKKLVDCTEAELRGFYAHCESMLNNESEKDPGRYVLIKITKDQRMRCNTELFLRWLNTEHAIPRFRFLEALNGFFDTNKDQIDPKTFPIGEIIEDCPEEFADIPSSWVHTGCLYQLGHFDKKHLTLSFILKQGVWFTTQESKDLTEKDADGNLRDRLDVVKEKLKLPQAVRIHTKSTGLSYAQLRALINLKSKKYSDLTTDQLRLLRDRILFNLEDEAKAHAKQWEERKRQIEQVCEAKGFTLS